MESTGGIKAKALDAISLPPEVASKTFAVAELEYGTASQNGSVKLIEAGPFDAIYLSQDEYCVVWDKDFKCSGEFHLIDEVFVEYLAYLMPELYGVTMHRYSTTVAVAWATPGAEDSTLGEGLTRLSAMASSIICGDVTVEQLWKQLYTPENTPKIEAMRVARMEADLIVQALMSSTPTGLAPGEL